jgi:hypothetical protein
MLGLAGPFGGDTTSSYGTYHQGLGIGAMAGYAFHPNFGVVGFFQHIWTSRAYRDTSTTQPSENTVNLNLYGGEPHHKVATRDLVTTGEAAPEILRIAQEEHVDLIVIASHGLAGWRRLVFGSVTEKVVRQATCPVLTIVAPPEVKR